MVVVGPGSHSGGKAAYGEAKSRLIRHMLPFVADMYLFICSSILHCVSGCITGRPPRHREDTVGQGEIVGQQQCVNRTWKATERRAIEQIKANRRDDTPLVAYPEWKGQRNFSMLSLMFHPVVLSISHQFPIFVLHNPISPFSFSSPSPSPPSLPSPFHPSGSCRGGWCPFLLPGRF